ncbi:APC family permease [Pseudonocardia sp. GCM10023141]|uniref:APC family permease n=1 Tax=Pseudonocardia sp. GCM10023141 TaxID=3252653 RepID=UPI00362157C3
MTGSSTSGGGLTTPRIVFLVVAAAAPMAAIVGLVPLQYAIGNGAGAPAAFVIAGLVLLCFGVGYAAMSRRITNTGGFYTFISRGLGRPQGVAGALVALVAYTAVGLQLVGGFGYFTQLVLAQQLGVTLPWELYSALGVAGAAVLTYRRVDLSARVLGLLMVGEIGVLLVLDVAVVGHRGAAALPLASITPSTALTGLAVASVFAFSAFIGFESAALYGEESRNPARTIPMATYWALAVITVFYGLTSWIGVGAVGADQVRDVAGQQLGNYFFTLNDQYVGTVMTTIMSVLMCTSLFASLVAVQNAASRYIYALGRERVLPRAVGRTHAVHGSPARASLVVTAVNVVVPAIYALAGLDPYLNLATSMGGLGVVGIIVIQAAAAASVIGFFRGRADRHWWRTLVAPGIGLVGLVVAVVLIVANFSLVTGTDSAIVNGLPWLIVIAAAGGLGYALWLRGNRPEIYAGLAAESHVRGEPAMSEAATAPETATAPEPA